jgi:hypothetical protein
VEISARLRREWQAVGFLHPESLPSSADLDFSAVFSLARSALIASAFGDSILAESLFFGFRALGRLPESELALGAFFRRLIHHGLAAGSYLCPDPFHQGRDLSSDFSRSSTNTKLAFWLGNR